MKEFLEFIVGEDSNSIGRKAMPLFYFEIKVLSQTPWNQSIKICIGKIVLNLISLFLIL